MFRIGEFSRLGKVTVKTLHHYDDIGLLVPAHVDEFNGYRYYTADQLVELNRVVRLREIGFSLADIAALLRDGGPADLFERRRAELLAESERIDRRLASLDGYINERKDHAMSNDVSVRTIPACTVFAFQTVIPTYAALNEIMPALGQRVAAANPGLECSPDDYCFNVYLDEEYRDTDIRVEICQAVTTRGADGDGIVFKDLPQITAACVTHPGDYAGIGAAYATVMTWVTDNGYRVVGPARESYIHGVWDCDDVADWRTEIQVPVIRDRA